MFPEIFLSQKVDAFWNKAQSRRNAISSTNK